MNETVAIPNYSKIPTASIVQKRKMRGTETSWQVVTGLLLLLIVEIPFEIGGRKYNLDRGESSLFNDCHAICIGKNRNTD